ncbi:bifunctional protein-serine/threonine kinase/phosphatase [Vibrio sp. 99-70-13A1]|nr:bifunctional protein-serine/threonine kinase/phosphatase [Vibrio sp. 99-70-13A1]NOH98843.1 bifunctional protein-serine/threonine kinase/phosphatase [Vibrio sp. 99-70-13A1]
MDQAFKNPEQDIAISQNSNQLELRYGGCSLQGRRDENQDALIVKHPKLTAERELKGSIACIADGVSCSSHGQQASHTSVMQFVTDYYATPNSWTVKKSAQKVLTALNSWLFSSSEKQNLSHNSLVTTFSAVIFKSNTAHIFHVGDSRIYRYRSPLEHNQTANQSAGDQQRDSEKKRNKLHQKQSSPFHKQSNPLNNQSNTLQKQSNPLTLLTRDHQRKSFGDNHFLTRALGMDNKLDIDYQAIPLQQGDIFLLTTDGVHDYLSEAEILAELDKMKHPFGEGNQEASGTLKETQNLDTSSSQASIEQRNTLNADHFETTTHSLCHKALSHNSKDNITSLLVEVTHLPKPSHLEFQANIRSRVIPPALKVGNTIDGFKVTKVIHAGARSHVYQVTEIDTQKEYIFKAPSLHYSEDQDTITGFCNEQWAGTQLDNKKIMKVYPCPPHSKFLYQLCEPIQGITLRQWMFDNQSIVRSTDKLDEIRRIIRDVISAVRVLQRADMVHRDLKPENIMLLPSGEIKLIDLGAVLVKSLQELEPKDTASGQHSKQAPLGAANYIAPEYLNSGEASIQSDLFSVGVICYEMLTGELPYKEMDTQSLAKARHQEWHYISFVDKHSHLPAWLDLTLKKACHPSPNSRYQVLSEFVEDIYSPNSSLVEKQKNSPFINRQPLQFWKLLALLLGFVAIAEFLLLLQ